MKLLQVNSNMKIVFNH